MTQYIASLTEDECTNLNHDWSVWARDNQLPPEGDWQTWLALAGRGWGKTRTGAEWVNDKARSGKYDRIALVAPTTADVRDVMVEGESGILAVSHPNFRPTYMPSKRKVVWPNGIVAYTYSAEEPERLRGPQHTLSWCDEVASWRYAEAMDMLDFGLRLGTNPQKLITTTPKPIKLIKDILADPHTVTVKGSTFDNRANLAPAFFDKIIGKYEGTNLGRQELYADILDDIEGALWTREMLEQTRLRFDDPLPPFRRVVVGCDPTVKKLPDKNSDECGIVVGALGLDNRGYILSDKSLKATPFKWASEVVKAYKIHNADRIVAEINNGGALVEATIRIVPDGQNVSYKAVHAAKGKIARAEPIAALYEQNKVSHIGQFAVLEDEMCTYEAKPGQESPNRLDALVWVLTELMIGKQKNLAVGPAMDLDQANYWNKMSNG